MTGRQNASGQSGPIGKLADAWDRRPVRGTMKTAVAVLGVVLAATATPALLVPGHKPNCQKDPLAGVYKPSRFKILETCAEVRGTVIAWRHEHDGDWHVSMAMDEPGWVNDLNVRRQHGYTVVEFIPFGPHVKLRAGERLELLGTKVLDLQHGNHKTTGWVELHPAFKVRVADQPSTRRANRRALAPPTEGDDAE